MKVELLSGLRSLLKILGSAAAVHGFGTGAEWEVISGAIVALAGAAWSIYEARKAKKEVVSE